MQWYFLNNIFSVTRTLPCLRVAVTVKGRTGHGRDRTGTCPAEEPWSGWQRQACQIWKWGRKGSYKWRQISQHEEWRWRLEKALKNTLCKGFGLLALLDWHGCLFPSLALPLPLKTAPPESPSGDHPGMRASLQHAVTAEESMLVCSFCLINLYLANCMFWLLTS